MRGESNITLKRAIPRNGVLVLTGYGVRVTVERGHLTVKDGRGSERREARFSRASRNLKRLVVIGHTGSVSLETLRWRRDLGCAFVQIDKDGEIVLASGSAGLDDPRLRRAQAFAPWNGAGIALARNLVSRKLTGQASILETKFDRAGDAERIRDLAVALAAADTPDVLRQIEAEAAATYWRAWTDVPIR